MARRHVESPRRVRTQPRSVPPALADGSTAPGAAAGPMAVPTTGYPRAEPLHGDGAKRTTISIHQGKGGARRKERDASEDATGNRAELRADGTGGRSKDPGQRPGTLRLRKSLAKWCCRAEERRLTGCSDRRRWRLARAWGQGQGREPLQLRNLLRLANLSFFRTKKLLNC